MWICSKLGFFSFVKKGKPETWQIRARCENDLRLLLHATGLDEEVIETPQGDYAFRIVVGRAGRDRVFSALANSIDYANFKSCISALPDQRDKLPAYHDFWGRMLQLQKKATQMNNKRTEKERSRQEIFKTNGGFWTRMLIAIGSFRGRHGHWPTKLRLSQAALKELKNTHLTPLGFQLLEAKLKMIPGDKEEYVAEDETGLTFDYDQDERIGEQPWKRATKWIWNLTE